MFPISCFAVKLNQFSSASLKAQYRFITGLIKQNYIQTATNSTASAKEVTVFRLDFCKWDFLFYLKVCTVFFPQENKTY